MLGNWTSAFRCYESHNLEDPSFIIAVVSPLDKPAYHRFLSFFLLARFWSGSKHMPSHIKTLALTHPGAGERGKEQEQINSLLTQHV